MAEQEALAPTSEPVAAPAPAPAPAPKPPASNSNMEGDFIPRVIHCNDRPPNEPFKFCDNRISTAKYTPLTFLPKNFWEQMHRIANVYFLVIAVLQQIPGVSPTGKFTTILPLSIVLGFTAAKEALEDWKRHKSDKKTNNSKAQVLVNGKWETTKWRDVRVGDVVKVVNRQYFPADLLVLSTSENLGMCYIETANLDGETNLKIRQAIPETVHLGEGGDDGPITKFAAVIECEQPNNRLYNFDARMKFAGHDYSLANKQILLRGSVLRNTQWVYGLAIFTGKDSKLMMNSNKTPLKRTSVERIANKQIVLIFIFQLLLCIFCAIANTMWTGRNQDRARYLQMESLNASEEGTKSFLTFFILFNNLIPISLYVSMEVVKFGQAQFINWDADMYYPVNDTPALSRTSNLNEELGQIEYIFSDKTGTLTRNLMEFRKCTIGGQKYGDNNGMAVPIAKFNFVDQKFSDDASSQDVHGELCRKFLLLLAVCHTIIPETSDDGELVYQAASPDEDALVTAAKELGFFFNGRDPKTITININGADETFEILNILEFNSTRKRMSVIARTPQGKIILFCKGADTVIYERLKANQHYGDVTLKHLEDFAEEGLRTLVLAQVELDEKFYNEWNQKFHAANTSLEDRDQKLADVAELIEKDLELIGATAIEDKLQEGVPECIADLAQAGIKIWVLTGDKQETAINIGYSCKLLTQQMQLIILNEETAEDTLEEVQKKIKEVTEIMQDPEAHGLELGLIVDGLTLTFALDGEVKIKLLELATMCKAVIACRVSPLQKSLIVKLVKENVRDPHPPITLAIGDGANDVAMIQAAHVGIGISGEEGLQAARAADYAIAQFRFLKKLLLVHGNWSYRRISKLILYSFYKNIALYLVQFWFTLNNGFSGQTVFERWTIAMYNVLFTSLPCLVVGLVDQDLMPKTLMDFPQLYIPGQKKQFFNTKVFWMWITNAIYHSVVIFYTVRHLFKYGVYSSSGVTVGLYEFGVVIYSVMVIVVNIKMGLVTSYFTWLNFSTTALMIFNWFVFIALYAQFSKISPDMYGADKQLFGTWSFWFGIFLASCIALARDYLWKYVKRTFLPDSYHIYQEVARLDEKPHLNPHSGPPVEKLRAAVSSLEVLRYLSKAPAKSTGFAYDAAPAGHVDAIRNNPT